MKERAEENDKMDVHIASAKRTNKNVRINHQPGPVTAKTSLIWCSEDVRHAGLHFLSRHGAEGVHRKSESSKHDADRYI